MVLTGSGIWCLAILLAPMLHLQVVYSFFSLICHQNPLRSWQILGEPLPVCVRCCCIYLGFLIATLFSARPNPKLLELAVILTLGEFILAVTLVDSAWLRGLTGLFLGAQVSPFVTVGIQEMIQTRFRRGAV
jgi:uncharacterized membrane protein